MRPPRGSTRRADAPTLRQRGSSFRIPSMTGAGGGAFALTYSAELRAERKGRSGSIVDTDPNRYRRFLRPALAAMEPDAPRGGWARRRIEGKALSVLRLAKASATYAGGADYIAWKINRHAGTNIELKPWQKRHPLLAAISLLPRLLRSGAIRRPRYSAAATAWTVRRDGCAAGRGRWVVAFAFADHPVTNSTAIRPARLQFPGPCRDRSFG